MKTAVVFFSNDGSTKVAADILAAKLGADVFELEEAKKRGRSHLSFMAAGFGASIGKRSKLKDSYAKRMGEYGSIYIGTPIWAGKATPAVNRFVHALSAKGKQIIVFTVQADKNPDVTLSKGPDILKDILEKKGASVIKILRLYGAPPGQTASIEDIQKQIDNKL